MIDRDCDSGDDRIANAMDWDSGCGDRSRSHMDHRVGTNRDVDNCRVDAAMHVRVRDTIVLLRIDREILVEDGP